MYEKCHKPNKIGLLGGFVRVIEWEGEGSSSSSRSRVLKSWASSSLITYILRDYNNTNLNIPSIVPKVVISRHKNLRISPLSLCHLTPDTIVPFWLDLQNYSYKYTLSRSLFSPQFQFVQSADLCSQHCSSSANIGRLSCIGVRTVIGNQPPTTSQWISQY